MQPGCNAICNDDDRRQNSKTVAKGGILFCADGEHPLFAINILQICKSLISNIEMATILEQL